MTNGDVIAYNTASFICALFVLEFGANKFNDHTVVVAERTGISQTIIGLLTAGAEWEELAVVVVSIARKRPSLAVGNIIGSAISNILGAFSLGLLFYKKDERIVFDKSSRIYTALLLPLTVLVAAGLLCGSRYHDLDKVFGGIAIGLFFVYMASIAWAISRGRLHAPELSDSDSDSGSDESEDEQVEALLSPSPGYGSIETPCEIRTSDVEALQAHASSELRQSHNDHSYSHSLLYHISFLILGFLSIILSSYVLSTSATNLADATNISDITFGVVILSISTTLPEKFIAALGGAKGHAGVVVANTVGSNIFLLTLCMGVWWVSTSGGSDSDERDEVTIAELTWMLGATAVMTVTVWFGAQWSRWIGGFMLLGYGVFLVLECTVRRHGG